MRNLRRMTTCVVAAVIMIGGAVTAAAGPSNEKTVLTFSEPVMVPGATLRPGTYTFQLMDAASNRHVVQVTTEDGSNVVALMQAVPTARQDVTDDTVLKFNPTDTGSPPALNAWFYPGSVYGHKFIYPDDQVREIAQRTKTMVLSSDVPGTDLEKGTLRTYDPAGTPTAWRVDEATMREWDEWRHTRASAPMVKSDFRGLRVTLEALEDNAQKYLGKTISVDGDIEDVLGPRAFIIDQPNWGDLESEMLVYVPTSRAVRLREDDRVTVTGTVEPFVRTDLAGEWGWRRLDREVEADIVKKPVLVASRIVGGNNSVAMILNIDPSASKAATSGGAATPSTTASLTTLGRIVRGNEALVGRHVALEGVTVESIAADGGFFLAERNSTLFVLPAHRDEIEVTAGDTLGLDGVVLQMPSNIEDRLDAPEGANDDIYVYAMSTDT